jgi:argininosuccinate lyase
VIEGLELFPGRTSAAASGLLAATDVADFLVGKGVPFRDAHEIVGRLVRQLVAEGRDFGALTPAEWQQHSRLFDESVGAVIRPEASVRARKTPQSTHPQAVAAAINDVNGWLRRVLAP